MPSYSCQLLSSYHLCSTWGGFCNPTSTKILGYIQIRKGRNKVGVMGSLQLFLMLFSKEQTFPTLSISFFVYYMSPVFSLFYFFNGTAVIIALWNWANKFWNGDFISSVAWGWGLH